LVGRVVIRQQTKHQPSDQRFTLTVNASNGGSAGLVAIP